MVCPVAITDVIIHEHVINEIIDIQKCTHRSVVFLNRQILSSEGMQLSVIIRTSLKHVIGTVLD